MSEFSSRTEAVVLAQFIEQLLADEAVGGIRPLEEYQQEYPGFEEVIAAEYLRTGVRQHEPEPTRDPSQSPHEPNQVGEYQILERIGSGGQGVVYRARHLLIGKTVALKVLTHSMANPNALRRFQREASVASRLDHRAICPVYSAGVDQGVPYIAMRLIEGQSLAQWIQQRRDSWPGFASRRDWEAHLNHVLDLLIPIADGLQAAHRIEIIHRDVTPQNILIDGEENVYLADFGLAADRQDTTELTRTGDGLGTPRYMAPEQRTGSRGSADGRSDVYSLGVILYEASTLHDPATVNRIVLPKPKSANGAPLDGVRVRDLIAVVDKAVSDEPGRRYATSADFLCDLQALRNYRAVSVKRLRPWVLPYRWFQRNRTLAKALVALAIFVTMSSWYAADSILRMTDKADFDAYLGNIKEAQAQISEGSIVLARGILIDIPRDFRQWEWRHLYEKRDSSLRSMDLSERTPIRLLPGIGGVEVGFEDGSITNLKTRLSWRAPSQQKRVLGVGLTSSGKVFRANAVDGRILLEVSGGNQLESDPLELRSDQVEFNLHSAQFFSQLGYWLLIGDRGELAVGRGSSAGDSTVIENLAVGEIPADRLRLVAVNQREGLAALALQSNLGAGTRIFVVDLIRDKVFPVWRQEKHVVTAMAFSEDGLRLLIGYKEYIRGTSSQLAVIGVQARLPAFSIPFPHDEVSTILEDRTKIWVGSSRGSIHSYDFALSESFESLHGHTGRVLDLCLTADGDLWSLGEDQALKAWGGDVSYRIPVYRPGITSIVIDPDNVLWLGREDDGLAGWDLETGRLIHEVDAEHPLSVGFDAEENAVTWYHVNYWGGCDKGDPTRELGGALPGLDQRAIAYPHHYLGRLVLLSESNGMRQLDVLGIDDLSRPIASLQGFTAAPSKVRGAKHGNRIAMLDVKGRAFVWDLAQGSDPIWSQEVHDSKACALSEDGSRLAVGNKNGVVMLYDIDHPSKNPEVLDLGREENVKTIAFHPIEDRLAVGYDDGEIMIWDPARAVVVLALDSVGTQPVHSSWSPDGSFLVVTATGGLVRVWQDRPVSRKLRPPRATTRWDSIRSHSGVGGWLDSDSIGWRAMSLGIQSGAGDLLRIPMQPRIWYEAALRASEYSLQRDPSDPRALRNRFLARVRLEQWDKAKADLVGLRSAVLSSTLLSSQYDEFCLLFDESLQASDSYSRMDIRKIADLTVRCLIAEAYLAMDAPHVLTWIEAQLEKSHSRSLSKLAIQEEAQQSGWEKQHVDWAMELFPESKVIRKIQRDFSAAVVLDPNLERSFYQLALDFTGPRLGNQNMKSDLRTLAGAAYYRLQQYESAREQLLLAANSESREGTGRSLLRVAFLAMVEHALGHSEDALIAYNECKVLLTKEYLDLDASLSVLLDEVETVVR